MEFLGTVTAYERPNHSAVHLEGDAFSIDAIYQFESVSGNETRVTQNSKVTPKGILKIFFLLFGWMMQKANCKATQKELDSLKAFCESYEGS